jgi:hypothetical protein
MTIVLERFDIPERGVLKLDLHESIEIRVTAEEARRKVNSWVHEYVSYMMHAEAPTLVIGEQVVWRVPVTLTSSQVGEVGMVGTVRVDVRSGKMNNTDECKEQLIHCARELAAKLPPFQLIETLPEQFIPTHLAQANTVQLSAGNG